VALNTHCQGQRFPDQIMLRWHALSSDFGRGGNKIRAWQDRGFSLTSPRELSTATTMLSLQNPRE
jgi:hypothetical protein